MAETSRRPALPAWAVVSPKRLAHIERVAATVAAWADAMGVDAAERDRWLRAAWLHDALRDAPPDTLRALAPESEGPVDVWHGPAAAARAVQDGEADAGVLNAVRYHSLGFADWERVGDVLYAADYLEPGRKYDPELRAELRERLPRDFAGVFREVVRNRVLYGVRSGWPLHPQTVGLWNRVADSLPAD